MPGLLFNQQAEVLPSSKVQPVPGRLDKFCVLDVGSTTTKAILFIRENNWRYVRQERPTTVEKPYEDVTFGVVNAMRALEKETGEVLLRDGLPCVPTFSTSSAGGGLAVVVAGLVREVTTRSAERVALGAGAIIQDVIALDDGRTPYRKIQMLEKLRPDMVLLAGGFDGGSVYGPVFLAELINQSDLRPKLSRDLKLPVIFAGNQAASKYVEQTLTERFMYIGQPNIRPSSNRENLEPARDAIHDVFMDHVMSRAPGYDKYKTWVSAPILPTPAAMEKILALVSKEMSGKLLVIDIGGATTDVFTAANGRVFRTVSANLGMSYSILNVVRQGGLNAIKELLDFQISDSELLDRIGNKYLRPTTLPEDVEQTKIECAVASVAIREAVRQHFDVLYGIALSLSEEDLGWSDFKKSRRGKKRKDNRPTLDDYDMVIGSGGKLSHSPRPTAAMMLLNALLPHGVLDLAVDSAFMFPHLGALSQLDKDLALELFYELGLIRLGTVVAPSGTAKPGKSVVKVTGGTDAKRAIDETVAYGELKFIKLNPGERASVDIDVRKLKLEERRVEFDDSCCGLIVDVRTRQGDLQSGFFIDEADLPPKREAEAGPAGTVRRGEIRERRELAIPGEVFVKVGDTVAPQDIIAKSTRSFRRPFFLNVAEGLKISPEELPRYFHKKVGDEVTKGELLAQRKLPLFTPSGPALRTFKMFGVGKLVQKKNPLNVRTYSSQVSGTIEKILPTGTVVVREKAERAAKLYSVNVAKHYDMHPEQIKPFLVCEVGQDVEKGQVVARKGLPGDPTACKSPARGRIKEINMEYGVVIIEPLLEELQLSAWLPGRVEAITEKGAEIVTRGTLIPGVWGGGDPVAGPVAGDDVTPGSVVIRETAESADLELCRSGRAVGLVCAGLHFGDVDAAELSFAVVVLRGFGSQNWPAELKGILDLPPGRLVALDPVTQLRAGVRRPRVIIPEA